MNNVLRTDFLFNDKDGAKVDALHKKLLSANNDFNNLGKNLTFGKTITENSELAVKSVEKLKTKVADFKTTTDSQTFKPTISRHWENEANQISASVKKAETAIDGLNNKTYAPGQPTGFRASEPNGKNALPDFSRFDGLEKKAAETGKGLQNLAAARLDSGQINDLTKDIVRASERSRQLERDIVNIKRELASPTRKSSIKFLTDELRGAEREADSLNRKLSTLAGAGGTGRDAVGRPTGLKLSGFQKTNLGYQINDVATQAALGQSPAQIIASQGGQIAQIFSAEQVSAFTAKYSALLPVLGLGSAALLLTYKITGDIRTSAEQRLKTEEKIASAVNKQLLAAKELRDSFEAQRKAAAEARQLQNYQQDTSIDQIRARKALLDQLLPGISPVDLRVGKTTFKSDYRNLADERAALENQLAEFDRQQQLTRRNSPDAAFAQSFEARRKAEEEEFQKQQQRQQKAAAEFAQSVEKGKEKVKELGKTYTEVFDNLSQKSNAQNPFVSVFSDGEKALKSLKEQLKGLPADLQNGAISLQQRINRNALFSARLDNNLDTFDLRERANQFRNPYDAAKSAKEREEIAKRYADAGGYVPGGNLGSFLTKQAGGFDKLSPNQIRELYETSLLNANTQFNGGNNQNSLISALAGNRLRDENQNQSVNDRLQKQLSIIYGGASSAEEKAIADRKLLSLSSNINPNDINAALRESIALANEREADRRETAEKQARILDENRNETLARIADNQEKLLKIAEKEGIKGIMDFIEIQVKDDTSGGIKVLGASPKPADMLADELNF